MAVWLSLPRICVLLLQIKSTVPVVSTDAIIARKAAAPKLSHRSLLDLHEQV